MNWKRLLAIALPAALVPTAIGVLVATTHWSVHATENAGHASVPVVWETVETGPSGGYMTRTSVPGGWLVRLSSSLTYVPDQEHQWGRQATEGGK